MLQKLRDQTQSTGFKILAGAIIVVLTLFGFGATNLFLGGDPEVASVGDFDITQGVLDMETERERRRLMAQMGPDFDPNAIDRLQLQGYALEQLIARNVLYQTAVELGVQASPDQTNAELVNNQSYQVDGRFNEDLYRQRVQMMGYTPLDFLTEVTNALSSDQLRSGLVDSAFVADWEVAESIRVITQKRDIAFLPLTVESFSSQVEVSDEDVATRYEEDQASYMTELSLDVDYVSLSVADLSDDSSIEITEQELQEEYAEDKAAFALDDQRDSSHILVQINDDRDDAAALALITEVNAKLNEGQEFEALAEEFSEDPGSSSQGGALGPVGKGVFDPEFEDALWAMTEPGEVSEPIKSSFGYHLIRLNEVIIQEYPGFDEQRASIEERLRRSRALDLLGERGVELERSAYDERFSLDETAAALGLEVQSATKVNRSQQEGHEALLGASAVLDALFSDEVLEGENSPLLEVGEDAVLVLRVSEQHEPEPIPLEEVADAIKSDLTREKALVAIEEAKTAAYARLEAGESVTEIAATYGQRWSTHEAATRTSSEVPAQVLQAAFELPRPPAGEKSIGEATLPDGAALVTVTRVEQGNVDVTTDTDVAQLEGGLQNRTRQVDFSSFFRAAEDELGVSRYVAMSEEP
jgi:peptidyl-prolyl cis-trans isomerase D